MNLNIPVGIIRSLPYIASCAFLAGIAATSAVQGWTRREVRFFVMLLLAGTAWLIVALLEIVSPSPEIKRLWDTIHWPIALCAGAFYAMFSFAYVGPPNKKMSPAMLTLFVVPVAIGIVVSGLSLFGLKALLYSSLDGTIGLPYSELRAESSTFVLVFKAYEVAIIGWSCFILANYVRKAGSERRMSAVYVLLGLLMAPVGAVFRVFGISVFSTSGSLQGWFALGAMFSMYGLFSQKLFGSVTMARRAVMDTLLDPVFVLDEVGEVVDCNAAARTLLGSGSKDPIGEPARELFSGWPSSVAAALDFPEAETELDLPDRDGIPRRSYRITVASNAAKDKSVGWKLLVFNDITGQKLDARDMAATNEELEFWVKQRTSALRLEVAQRTAAEERLRELNEEMAKTQKEIMWTLSEVVESRSRETAYHVIRVGEYTRILSQACGLSDEEIDIMMTAAPMHDVGKISIPDAILGKPGLLTPEEREVMKRHTTVGKDILGSSRRSLLRAASVIAFEHHERWDGKGYPLGISGNDISLSGRIVSMCDVFDALYNKRVYKDAWPLEKVLELFRNESGGAFEPRLVDMLFKNLDDILEITKRFTDDVQVIKT